MKSSIVVLVVLCAAVTGGAIFYHSRQASSPVPANPAMAGPPSPATVVAEQNNYRENERKLQ
jgi:hypothetical protein